MKVKATLDLYADMGGSSRNGTSCQGYLPGNTSYESVVKVFGRPRRGMSPDGKTKTEWIGRINGLEFSIYDYKSINEAEKNTDWHIGGKVKLVAELVNLYFRQALK